MSVPVIRVTGLGKRYYLSHEKRADTLRDSLTRGLGGLWRRLNNPETRSDAEEFWALRDVGFEINQGDVVGIVGRNGAGKSTLLKILSRIIEPTAGRAVIRGRVASLLEVGTGFHPELSGRENIFLNGAILGMSRVEIARKFDEIVAFAEVERFLDTPVKHYSSGMYVRLAFAVAAHLEPEILIVDEVLAVGDMQFQQKCLGKIRKVAASEGRTVLLVTHNPSVVLGLCNRAIYLQAGQVKRDGEAKAVISDYLATGASHQFEREAPATAPAAITRAAIATRMSARGAELVLEVRISCRRATRCALEVKLHDAIGQPVAFASLGSMTPGEQVALPPGETDVACAIDISQLASGRYGASLKLEVPFVETLDEVAHCLNFEHEAAAPEGSTHVLQQSWGLGYMTLPARRIS
ncbi:MAG: Teichoic-acid-transporting ATPase [Lacunisphaera sp.]|nr:Teichoic-acid-transporting ATPase [Lacunisphaera sp.]